MHSDSPTKREQRTSGIPSADESQHRFSCLCHPLATMLSRCIRPALTAQRAAPAAQRAAALSSSSKAALSRPSSSVRKTALDAARASAVASAQGSKRFASSAEGSSDGSVEVSAAEDLRFLLEVSGWRVMDDLGAGGVVGRSGGTQRSLRCTTSLALFLTRACAVVAAPARLPPPRGRSWGRTLVPAKLVRDRC